MRSLAEQVSLVEQCLLLQGHDVCLRGSLDAHRLEHHAAEEGVL